MKFNFCKLCKICCKFDGSFVSKQELKWLQNPKATLIKGKLYQLSGSNKKCQYLGKKGCVLKKKPLACEIYPFLPTEKGWVVRTICPYWWKLDDKMLKKVKIQFTKRRRDWVGKVK